MAFGDIPGPHPIYAKKADLRVAGVHRQQQGGITGSGVRGQGAESVVLSGGYEDDVDNGDAILYTGHGGRDPKTGKQIADQQFTLLNKSLAENVSSGQPVRVVRKVPGGFSYDGLFSVDAAYDVLGVRGFRICRFELTKLSGAAAKTPPYVPAPLPGKSRRQTVVTERLVRDTAQSLAVKSGHEYRCQVCRATVPTRSGGYAEGAHIIPLGKPYNGPDVASNILCLCPNHHTSLDKGGIYVDSACVVRVSDGTAIGPLHVAPWHGLDMTSFEHHRDRFGYL